MNAETMDFIYLDNNSTTLIDDEVAAAIAACRREKFVNPSSQHQPGQRARRRLEQVRTGILETLGATTSGMSADQLVFTSGGTESNNLALIGLAFESDGSMPERKTVLVSAIEHPSMIGASQFLRRSGFQVKTIPALTSGVIDLNRLAEMLDESVRLVSVMSVNNETGVIQPTKQLAAMCQKLDVICHTDAVQAVGKLPVDFSALGVDALSFSGHKLHGPRGIGGLILKYGRKPFPLFFGGFQQQGIRPGTEDVCLGVGLYTAIQKFGPVTDATSQPIAELRNQLQSAITENCPHAVVIGSSVCRVPHTLNIAFKGVDRQEFLMAADMHQLAISTGSACASGSSEPSPVLVAMNADQDVINGSIRISLSALTTRHEIDLACQRIIKIANDLRR